MKTVAFYGTVSARSEQTLVCQRIATPFNLKRILVRFAPGCENLVFLRFFISLDAHAPSSGTPSGINILDEYGQVNYITGDDVLKDLEHEVECAEGGAYLKVYAKNDDYYDHSIDVQMFLEPIARK